MKVLIITTSVFEIQGILKFFGLEYKMCISSYRYSKPGCYVDFENTEAGNFNLIYRLTKLLSEKSYDLVINAGICGSYNKTMELGRVVRVEKDRFADFGAFEGSYFKDIFDMGLMKENDYPFQNKWLLEKPGMYDKVFTGLATVTGLTVNQIPISEFILNEITKEAEPLTESMEGAGFFFVCRSEKVNFIQIRSVSNYAGERDKSKWKLKLAIENLGISLKKAIDEI
jgi:futalosine hydrolase